MSVDTSAFLDHAMALALYESRSLFGDTRIAYIRSIIEPSYAIAHWIENERAETTMKGR